MPKLRSPWIHEPSKLTKVSLFRQRAKFSASSRAMPSFMPMTSGPLKAASTFTGHFAGGRPSLGFSAPFWATGVFAGSAGLGGSELPHATSATAVKTNNGR